MMGRLRAVGDAVTIEETGAVIPCAGFDPEG